MSHACIQNRLLYRVLVIVYEKDFYTRHHSSSDATVLATEIRPPERWVYILAVPVS